jgi:DNA-binding phage protein
MREMGNWREYQIRRLANDREAAIDYLQLTLEEYLVDGDLSFFLKELRVFIASQGGVSELSKRTSIDAETLLDALSNEDAPLFDILNTILNAFGCQLPTQHKVDANFSIKTAIFSANPLKRTSLPPLIDLIHSAQRTQRAAYRFPQNVFIR